jgi:SAM-dependent methyltransferase
VSDEPEVRLEGFGSWYAEKQGETGDPWHRSLIDPGLLAMLGPLPSGTRVLDLGCGNGYLSRRLARQGALVTGIDNSEELLVAARGREAEEPLGIRYLQRDASRLDGLADESFDVALANMSLIDIEDAAGAIRETGRVVQDRGRFVFSISHPCFDVDTRSQWVVDADAADPGTTRIYRKVTGYRTPHPDWFPWRLSPGKVAITVGYHRPLSWYAGELRSGGWVIVDLAEPTPTAEYEGHHVKKEWLEAIPLHLVVEARREPRR